MSDMMINQSLQYGLQVPDALRSGNLEVSSPYNGEQVASIATIHLLACANQDMA